MINLDDSGQIKEIDKSNMLGSIEALPNQCQQVWDEVKTLEIPEDYKFCKNLVVAGMGGSALGTHIFYSLYSGELRIPLQLINDYHLPTSVNEQTLVLISSYSGGTEETINCASEAKEKGAKILGITTGGKLGQFLVENNLPGYIFEPRYNFCNQPRMGLGYSILGQLSLFNRCNLINIQENNILEMISFLRNEMEKLKDAARLTVTALKDKLALIIGAEFLSGNTHVLANQLNENSKNFSCYFLIPELNHHLLEGFTHPETVKAFVALFLNSDFYEEKIKKKVNSTKEIISKNGLEVFEFKPEGDSKLKQSFATLLYGSFVSFYLSILYNQDPSPIPWVDYFQGRTKNLEQKI